MSVALGVNGLTRPLRRVDINIETWPTDTPAAPPPSDTTPAPAAPAEEEEGTCSGFGGTLLCYVLPVVAAAGLGVGIAAAAGAFDNPRDIHIRPAGAP